MSLKRLLAELRRRGVLKVAAVYAGLGWVALQGLSLLFQNFGAPDWVIRVTTTLVLIGFPLACLMAWGFDITPQGIRPIPLAYRAYAPQTAVGAAVPESSRSPTVAVLAFENLSGDPEQAYFSDGISEDIITDLAKLSGLRVIARNSSFTYKGKPADVKKVGRELGARYVVEGSVRKAGNRVRVTGQLIDAETGTHLWADRFDRDLGDVFAVQDELTLEIIEALRIRLSPEERARISRRLDVDIDAYSLFLRGREQALLLTASGNVEARKMLARAIAISPDFAAAHACVAFTHVDDYIMGHGAEPERSLETGLSIARRACGLDDEDAYAHAIHSVALLWNHRHDEALAEARRSLALAPSSAEGCMQLSNTQYYLGDIDGALRTLEAYMRLDPLYPEITLYFLAEAQAAAGLFDAAVATLRQRLERNPGSETSYVLLASCYGHLGRFAESRAAWAEALKIAPDLSLERRRTILPYRNPEILERRLEGLRRAGVSV